VQLKELNSKLRNKMVNVINEIKENTEEGGEAVEEIPEKGEEVIEEIVEKVEEKLKKEPEKKTSEDVSEEKPKVWEKTVEVEKEIKKEPEKSKEDKKEVVKPKEKPKKTEAIVSVENLPISTKHSIAICKFIKNKKIGQAISDLEQVLKLKKSVSMKGEIPHRKGKGAMSGRFPEKATSRFIILLKSLSKNSNYNGLENPTIVEAIANIGSRPYGRFGLVRKKRTHVKITARDRKTEEKKKAKK